MSVPAEGNKGLRGVLRRFADQPRQIRSLARAGNASQASLRCVLAAAVSYAFIIAWSVIVTCLLVAAVIPWATTSLSNVQDRPTPYALLILILLPALLAALIVVVATLLGIGLGAVGIFQKGRRMLGAVGLLLNVLMLAFAVGTALLAAAL